MKRLVLCCDGTWNSADQQSGERPTPTNVVKLAYRVAKRDGDVPQVLFYDQGVGTGNSMDRLLGGAFGAGLVENIFDAYRFLMANYERGDALYLFGFSRGAYTARSLAGMVRKCGILSRASVGRYADALDLYRDPDTHPDDPQPTAFREQHSICRGEGIPIAFVGVWDTVGALGIPIRGLRWLTRRKHQFHDTELSGSVRRAAHALAIDERRAPFAPTLWSDVQKEGQTVEQVWFPGVHSDVGGGYSEVDLSDIALEWMIGRAREAGLAFGDTLLAGNPLRPDPGGLMHDSKGGLYRLTRGLDRPIGLVPPHLGESVSGTTPLDPRQSLHPSVLARWDADPDYRPPAVREFLRRTGDPRKDAP
ncbi:MAG: DUF2235 domain-containing protein [Planctomycetota bacterium]|jgi:uncharacterized protein (DUF2235 family)